MEILGVDIGGSGIKGAPVDVENGRLAGKRHRIPTPQPASKGGRLGTTQSFRAFEPRAGSDLSAQ